MSVALMYERFPAKIDCLKQIEVSRWPDGKATCVYCGSDNVVESTAGKLRCNNCRTTFNPTVGTVFHNARLELQIWFAAAYIVLNPEQPTMTARQLAEALGIAKDTAWRMRRVILSKAGDQSVHLFMCRVVGLPDDTPLPRVKKKQKPRLLTVNKTDLPQAEFGDADKPLRLGVSEIACYVLDDGRRILSNAGMLKAMGMSRGGSGGADGDRLAHFMRGETLKPFMSQGLLDATAYPLLFNTPNNKVAHGYEATLLVDICDAVLEARKAGVLKTHQVHIAAQCEILVRAFAKVGIIALVDEITGYQEFRARDELNKILDKYIVKELVGWAKRFPDEFYEEMFRLRGWNYDPMSVARPGYVGTLTKDVIYARLPPGVIQELEKKNPPVRPGQRRWKHHQWLTEDVGQNHLKNHMIGVLALMRGAASWSQFHRMLERSYPRQDQPQQLEIPGTELEGIST